MASTQTPNKAALSTSKVTELKALCSQNGLPVSGNKGELVNRLLIHFESAQTASTPQPTPSKDLTLSSSKPAASNSSAAPPPSSNPAPATQAAPASAPTTTPKSAEPAQTTTPHTNNPPKNPQPPQVSTAESTVDSELEKRKLRAQRFGLDDSSLKTDGAPVDEDQLKKSLRAKRFGLTNEINPALDQPLADIKDAAEVIVKSTADLEWEARKRKRAEKFGLVDNPPASILKDGNFQRKNQKFNNARPRY
ncbi:hypothetical protein VP01_915g4 [Puccinia sorghi]|uniref:SAP domain-containing protein n=1 Tax=Puccinia sorghi TaxID=27349 RepID=A0A0L6U7G0_9BASI|nr:hypothetical protein VP01_915g4 [Puccinia sorghi]